MELRERWVRYGGADKPYGFMATSFWNSFRAASSEDVCARRVVGAGASLSRMSGDRGRLLKPCLRRLQDSPSSLTVGCKWCRESTGRAWSQAAAVPWLRRMCRRLKFADGIANCLKGLSVMARDSRSGISQVMRVDMPLWVFGLVGGDETGDYLEATSAIDLRWGSQLVNQLDSSMAS